MKRVLMGLAATFGVAVIIYLVLVAISIATDSTGHLQRGKAQLYNGGCCFVLEDFTLRVEAESGAGRTLIYAAEPEFNSSLTVSPELLLEGPVRAVVSFYYAYGHSGYACFPVMEFDSIETLVEGGLLLVFGDGTLTVQSGGRMEEFSFDRSPWMNAGGEEPAQENPIDAVYAEYSRDSGGSTLEIAMNAHLYSLLWENELRNAYWTLYDAVNRNFEDIQGKIMQNMLDYIELSNLQSELFATLTMSNAISSADEYGEVDMITATAARYAKFYERAEIYKNQALEVYALLERCGVEAGFAFDRELEKALFDGTLEERLSRENWDSDDRSLRLRYTDMPLLASLPGEDIYLYSVRPSGMVLQVESSNYFFEWANGRILPRQILPEILKRDFDGDGEDEIAVYTHYGSGTGINWMQLHMLEYDPEQRTFIESRLDADGAAELVRPHVSVSYDKGEKKVKIVAYGGEYTLEPPEDIDDTFAISELALTDIVNFCFEDGRIMLDQTIGYSNNKWATPHFALDLTAEVIWKDGAFSLENIEIAGADG